jgi:hypothetical protein
MVILSSIVKKKQSIVVILCFFFTLLLGFLTSNYYDNQKKNWGYEKWLSPFHKRGILGNGVKIAFLDTGSNSKNHDIMVKESISVLEMNQVLKIIMVMEHG